MKNKIKIIGGGLAGCEAAWQIAKRGIDVELYEMKPKKASAVHVSENLAELVCSNSLRSSDPTNACGLLKEEMSVFDSLIIEAAKKTAVPAGSALAVDRGAFSRYITKKLEENEHVKVIREEVTDLDGIDGITIIAAGPLASDALTESITSLTGESGLHFYDAVAPIISAESINFDVAYFASRYGKGNPTDYLNCPMTKEQYDIFYDALINAETAKMHDPDKDIRVFEGCMPVEIMAARGKDTLCYGPLKPVGLRREGENSYAVVQLRREDVEGDAYNIVGFQTHLTFPEQKRVFGLIPGLENAEFLRYGVMHRNTYIHSPGILSADYSMIQNPDIFFAGQITGVEGYVESAASGLAAGINAARRFKGEKPLIFPKETMIGAMANYISSYNGSDFQPMNANFGIVPKPAEKIKGGKKERYKVLSDIALDKIKRLRETV